MRKCVIKSYLILHTAKHPWQSLEIFWKQNVQFLERKNVNFPLDRFLRFDKKRKEI